MSEAITPQPPIEPDRQAIQKFDRNTLPPYLMVFSRIGEAVPLTTPDAQHVYKTLIFTQSGNALYIGRPAANILTKPRARLYDLGSLASGESDYYVDIDPEQAHEQLPRVVIGEPWSIPDRETGIVRAVLMYRKHRPLKPDMPDNAVYGDPMALATEVARHHKPHLDPLRRHRLSKLASTTLEILQSY